MDGNVQVTEEFDIFVEFCFKHGGTLRNHKQFGEMARVLKQKISDMHERLLTPREPDACPECGEEYSGACGKCAVGHERG